MADLIYFHIWNNHFKMWGYETFQNIETGKIRICFYWGRLADTLSKLQQLEKEMGFWDACDLIKEKIDEKLRKGYIAVPNIEYSKYSSGQISLSELIKIIEKEKK